MDYLIRMPINLKRPFDFSNSLFNYLDLKKYYSQPGKSTCAGQKLFGTATFIFANLH